MVVIVVTSYTRKRTSGKGSTSRRRCLRWSSTNRWSTKTSASSRQDACQIEPHTCEDSSRLQHQVRAVNVPTCGMANPPFTTIACSLIVECGGGSMRSTLYFVSRRWCRKPTTFSNCGRVRYSGSVLTIHLKEPRRSTHISLDISSASSALAFQP